MIKSNIFKIKCLKRVDKLYEITFGVVIVLLNTIKKFCYDFIINSCNCQLIKV